MTDAGTEAFVAEVEKEVAASSPSFDTALALARELLGFDILDISTATSVRFHAALVGLGPPSHPRRRDAAAAIAVLHLKLTSEPLSRDLLLARLFRSEVGVGFCWELPGRLRRWLDGAQERGRFSPEITLAVFLVVEAWARLYLLREPSAASVTVVQKFATARALICAQGMMDFLMPGARIEESRIDRTVSLSPESLTAAFVWLRLMGFSATKQVVLLSRCLTALSRLEEWDASQALVETFLRVDAFDSVERAAFNCVATFRHEDEWKHFSVAPELLVAEPLSYWLRAGARPGHADDESVPAIVDLVTSAWDTRRSQILSSRTRVESDDRISWGQELWAVEALVMHLDHLRQMGGVDSQIKQVEWKIASLVENFSARMSLASFATPRNGSKEDALEDGEGTSNASVAARGPSPRPRRDDHPERFEEGALEWPFAEPVSFVEDARLRIRCLELSEQGDTHQKVCRSHYMPAAEFLSLTLPVEASHFAAMIPPSAGYLLLCDLPDTEQPLVIMIVKTADGRMFISVRSRQDLGRFPPSHQFSAASRQLAEFDRQSRQAFDLHRDVSRTRTAERAFELLVFGGVDPTYPDRESSGLLGAMNKQVRLVNGVYGAVLESAISQLVCEGVSPRELQDCDLIVSPRGMCSTVPIDFLGKTQPLLEVFRSFTACPSLRLFARLRRTAAESPPIGIAGSPLNIRVAGWDPPREDGDHPFQGNGVRYLTALSHRLFNDVSHDTFPIDVRYAAETPLASLARVDQMFRSADLAIIYAHSDRASTGLRLSDGVYPRDHLRSESPADATAYGPRRASARLCCTCFGGCWTPDPNRPDGFSHILEAASLQMLLADEPKESDRQATLVASFLQEVHSGHAAETMHDLMRGWLVDVCAGKEWSEFAFARSRTELLRERIARFGDVRTLSSRAGLRELRRGRTGVEEASSMNVLADDVLAAITFAAMNVVGCTPRWSARDAG